MILVILGIAIALIAFGVFLVVAFDFDMFGFLTVIAGIVGFIVALIACIALICDVSMLKTVDERITMYQEENTKIEEQIADVVKQYQKYESDIIAEVAPESSMTLVALYPELKADTLVQKQIEVYTENNEKIKELREEQINGCVARWWLYFGG